MKININNWKVINNKLPLFAMFCFLGCLYLGCRTNYWYFLLLILIPFIVYKAKPNTYQLILLISIFLGYSLLIIFAWRFSLVELIKQNMYNHVRHAIFNFFDNHYDKEMSSFLKLILLNQKSKEIFIFYKQTVDLGIVWLMCISGFHISLLSRTITWCFKKKPIIGRYINIVVIAFYSYLLNFSYASLRIIIKLVLQPYFNLFKTKEFDRIGVAGLIICFLNPSCFKEYGFLLSFLICIAANCVSKLELNNKIINRLLINVIAFAVTIPFVISMNHKISLFTFINAFIFNNLSAFIFFYFFIFSWMPFMQVIHHGIMIATYFIIGNISLSNIFIYSNQWESYIVCIYYIALFVLLKIIYLIVINNKI